MVVVDCFVEIQRDGHWQFAGEMIPNPEYGYDLDEPPERPEPVFETTIKELAAILTDSGNPIRSSEPYIPVVPRRGLPEDLSEELSKWISRDVGEDWFFVNYFTVRELLKFGWEKRVMKRRAMVASKVAHLFAGCPTGFPMSKWPKDVEVSYSSWSKDGIEVEWFETYAEIASFFVKDLLPRLEKFGSPDHTRLVVTASW